MSTVELVINLSMRLKFYPIAVLYVVKIFRSMKLIKQLGGNVDLHWGDYGSFCFGFHNSFLSKRDFLGRYNLQFLYFTNEKGAWITSRFHQTAIGSVTRFDVSFASSWKASAVPSITNPLYFLVFYSGLSNLQTEMYRTSTPNLFLIEIWKAANDSSPGFVNVNLDPCTLLPRADLFKARRNSTEILS